MTQEQKLPKHVSLKKAVEIIGSRHLLEKLDRNPLKVTEVTVESIGKFLMEKKGFDQEYAEQFILEKIFPAI